MNKHHRLRLCLAVLLSIPLVASAGAFRLADQDAFATGRGEAFAATADNASAIYYNPAGIAHLEGDNFRAGIYGIYLNPTFEPPDAAENRGEVYELTKHYAAVPHFFYTHRPRDAAWSCGLGIYSPYGLSARWPDETGFRAVATHGSLTYFRINPVVAFELSPRLAIGGGLTVNYANMVLEQGLRPFTQPLTNYFRFEGDGWSVGYNLGVLWQVHETVSVGATFRSASRVNLDGRTEFEQYPLILPTKRMASSDFTFPLGAVFGISYRPSRWWNFEFDADYTDWSSFDTAYIQQEDPPFPLRARTPVTLEWKESWMFEFGLTRFFENGWHLSAGYVFNQNSVPDDYYSPLVADQDRHFFSAGIGRAGRRLSFDIAYQVGYGPDRVVTGSTPSSQPGLYAGQTADGTYDFTSHAIIFTVGCHF